MTMADITGFILAGGKSSRMGQDKASMLFRGKPMITHVIRPLLEVCKDVVIISSNSSHSQFGIPVLPDQLEGFGPVAAITTGLRSTKTNLNFFISCDCPLIDVNLLNTLIDSIGDFDAVLPYSGAQLHPLVGLYKVDVQETFERHLSKGQHKLMDVIQEINFTKLNMQESGLSADLVSNFNSPQDLDF